jgi:hypothetical protein
MGTSSRSSLGKKLLSKNSKSGLGSLQMARIIYDYAVDGGAAAAITPKKNVELPDNAVIVGGTINSTTAVTGALTNLTIGTSAGSSASALLGSTNKSSLGADAVVNAVPVFATPVKLSAKGKVTISTGVIEITLFYFVANA